MTGRSKPKRGAQEENIQPPPPPEPTAAIPGTEEKIAVMEWRVENGYTPHHRHDYMEEKRPK